MTSIALLPQILAWELFSIQLGCDVKVAKGSNFILWLDLNLKKNAIGENGFFSWKPNASQCEKFPRHVMPNRSISHNYAGFSQSQCNIFLNILHVELVLWSGNVNTAHPALAKMRCSFKRLIQCLCSPYKWVYTTKGQFLSCSL